MDAVLRLIESIELSLLPKLSKNFDESAEHSEYKIRINNIKHHFPEVVSLLGHINLQEHLELAPSVLSSLIIVYRELLSEGPWNTEKSKDYANKLNNNFERLYGITLDDILRENDIFNNQEIFDKCIENLHRKLTSDEFKKYPGRIEVYCSLMQDVKEYNANLSPLKTLPVSLLLIDDYIITNKIKGLKSCKSLLECLYYKDFQSGNYFDVIYGSLNKTLVEKDLEVTKLVHACCLELIRIVPSVIKNKKLGDLLTSILDQLSTETNLGRKLSCVRFLQSIISLHGVNCVKCKKLFMEIVCNILDTCTDVAVAEILLLATLECLQEWIKYCWCVWNLNTDQKLLTILFKHLYIFEVNDIVVYKVHNIIVALIGLSTKEQQNQILDNLAKSPDVDNPEFLKNVEMIRNAVIG